MELAQIKQYIMATLAANPTVSNIRTFHHDYRELMCTEIPYRRFQFNSLEQFLRSLTDVCEIKGSGPMALIYPIVTEKSKHVNELVMFQRDAKPRGRNQRPVPKRKFELPPRLTRCTNSIIERPPVYYKNFTNNVSSTSSAPQSAELPSLMDIKLDLPKLSQDLPELNRFYLAGGSLQETASCNRSKSDLSKSSNHHHHHHNKNVEKTENMMNQISSDPLVNNNNNKGYNSTGSSDYSEEASALAHSLQNTLNLQINDVEEDCTDVPKKVQENLKILIKEFDDGIWCCDLPDQYKKRFKSTLHYSEYGYSSLIEMCMDLRNIFHYHRPGEDDFLLYNRDKPMPETCNKKYTISSFAAKPRKLKLAALPDLEFSDFKSIIPNDIVKYGDELPNEFSVRDFKVNDTFDVVVAEVYDPSKFWIYLGTHDDSKFDDIMDEMQEFYGNTDNSNKYSIPPGACKQGLYCVALYRNEYHRAKILKVFKDKSVRIIYIDCGTVIRININGLCFLTLEFSKLPSQAIRCRLANIEPVLKEHPWSVSAVKHFRNLVREKPAKMRLSEIDSKDEFVYVFLAEITDPNNITYINEALVEAKLAVWDNQTDEEPKDRKNRLVLSNYACLVNDLYLYPTFKEIEDGLVPCSTDMQFLSEKHVPVELCLPQYFKLKDEIVSKNYHDMTDIQNAFSHGRHAPSLNPPDNDNKPEKDEIDYAMFGSLKNEIRAVYEEILKNAPKSSVCAAVADDVSTGKTGKLNEEIVNDKEIVPYKLLTNEYSSDTSTDLKNDIKSPDCAKALLTSAANIFDNPEDFGNGSSSDGNDDLAVSPVAPSRVLFVSVKEEKISEKKSSSVSWNDDNSSKESKAEFIKSLLSTNPFKSMLMKEVEEDPHHEHDVSHHTKEKEELKPATDSEQSSAELSYSTDRAQMIRGLSSPPPPPPPSPPQSINSSIPQINELQTSTNLLATGNNGLWNINAQPWVPVYPYCNSAVQYSPSYGNSVYPNPNVVHQHNYFYQYQIINSAQRPLQQHSIIPSVPPGFQARDFQMYQNRQMISSLRPNERLQQIKNNFRETQ